MSPCTKRLQRSTRSFASFSGLKVSVWACTAGAQMAPAPSRGGGSDAGGAFQESAAVEVVHGQSPLGQRERKREAERAVRDAGPYRHRTGGRASRSGAQADGAAGRERVALAEHGRHLRALVAAGHEGVRTGGVRRRPLRCRCHPRRTVRGARAACRRRPAGRPWPLAHAARSVELRAVGFSSTCMPVAVASQLAGQEVHRGRADEGRPRRGCSGRS